MRPGSPHTLATLFTGFVLLALPSPLLSREPASDSIAIAENSLPDGLPDAPDPHISLAAAEPQNQQTPDGQSQETQQPAQAPEAQSSSSAQTPAQQPDAEKSQHQKAEEQLKEQERQRNLGILPAFNISYRSDAVSLTASQKMRLAFRSSVDPVTFAAAFLVAGYHEALDDDTGFRWGIEGYGRRSGAAYLDAFDGTIIGNGILPSILHQDPRYFRLGHGTTMHRALYAVAASVICKHDNTGKWEPNYSNVAGNIISGAISNLYYPPSNSGIGQTISNGLTVTAEGGVASLFNEFWPDISRKFLHKDPTHGLDVRARALDAAEKQARQKKKQNQQ
jgi:hypothetical protein